MPRRRVKGEKETISFRDLQVLDFICRFGVVNRTAVQWWADTGRSVTLDRERRLREAGLIEVHPPIGRSGPMLAVTSRGLRLADRGELGPVRVSVWAANHSIVCAQVAAWLEGGGVGDTILSEREMLAEERQLGGRVYSAKRSYPDPGWHRPDLYRLTLQDDEPQEHAIEVELTAKAPERLVEDHRRLGGTELGRRALTRSSTSARRRSFPMSSERWRSPAPAGASRSRSSGSTTPPLPDLRASLAAA